MSVTDVILATFAATVTLIAVGVWSYRVVRTIRSYAKRLVTAVEANVAATGRASAAAELVHGELAFMRQVTQAAAGQQVEVPQPPIGRAGRMPPAFPQRDWSVYVPNPNAPDAKPEDTDASLLSQTEQEVMEAQAREEMRGRGIEPDEEGLPEAAVVDQA
jgi:hypothetical protein